MLRKARKQMYLHYICEIAQKYDGVREEPRNSNLGPQVEEFQRNVGEWCVGKAWCSCFVYSVCQEAAEVMGAETRVRKTARALAHYYYAPDDDLYWFRPSETELIKPGMLFIQIADESRISGARLRAFEKAPGHIGIVLSEIDADGWFKTAEGNTNPAGSREGGGVYIRRRHISDKIVGFVEPDYEF